MRHVEVPSDLLSQIGMLTRIDHETSEAMTREMSVRSLSKGEMLFQEGEQGSELYVVLDGKLKLTRRFQDGRESVMAVLSAGQVFGELSLFDQGPRTASAVALTRSRVASLDHAVLLRWMERDPSIGHGLLTLLSARLRKANDVVADLVFCDVPARVAQAILDLSARFGREAHEVIYVDHDLTQGELAQLVGASRETVNKALADFASRGWIRTRPRSLTVFNPERLRERAR